jgi:hypothetical protein
MLDSFFSKRSRGPIVSEHDQILLSSVLQFCDTSSRDGSVNLWCKECYVSICTEMNVKELRRTVTYFGSRRGQA